MNLKKFKPTSPGVRHKIVLKKSQLALKNSLLKNLILPKKQSFGRSSYQGNITSWQKGGGVKRKFRCLNEMNSVGGFLSLGSFYDPNRKTFISLHFNLVNEMFEFGVASSFVLTGSCLIKQEVLNSFGLGFRSSLNSFPAGSIISNIGPKYKKLGTFVRSAGSSARLVQKGDGITKIKLPSKQLITVPSSYFASLGANSNIKQRFIVLGKAGFNRLKGKRPKTRGIAMNPLDHPHGGRTNGGRPCVTP